MNNLSLYIHIPFCVRKCNYCDFLSAPCDEKTKQEYVEALCCEIEQRAKEFRSKKVDTVFLGGGTPSILSSSQMSRIMSAIRDGFQVLPEAEISMEMNPGTVDREKLEVYKRLGINRLSIGLQSADNEELRVLGRIHTWEEFLQTWNMVREAGFTNVNIDLMSALPGQSLESYEKTLRKVLALKPEHISAYSLIVEEGTLFFEWFGDEKEKQQDKHKDGQSIENRKSTSWDTEIDLKNRKLPDELIDRKMYDITKQLLEEQGYYRYEISNYALKGYECKHNIGYWKRKEYLGLGLGAASLLLVDIRKENHKESEDSKKTNWRCSNISDLQTYLEMGRQKKEDSLKINQTKKMETKGSGTENEKWTEEQTKLSLTEQMEEFMFLGLRMMKGISIEEFEKQFGKNLQQVYGKQIEKLQKQGLLKADEKAKSYALTAKGIDVSNQVFVEFIM